MNFEGGPITIMAIGLEELEPGTFHLTKYEARTVITAFDNAGLRISFADGEVDMIAKCAANPQDFLLEQVGRVLRKYHTFNRLTCSTSFRQTF
jgi:hypothetical protein